MNKRPKVSIITITYNQEKFVAKTLEGFVMQKTNFPFVAIVADDCSTDGTRKVITEYAKKYPDIIKPLFREKNLGAWQNFTDAIRSAKSPYTALCEGDDYWTSDEKLQKQADFLDSHPKYGLCFHPVKVVVEGKRKTYTSPNPKEKSQFTVEELIKRNFIQTNSVMYRTQDYTKLAPGMMPGDWYLHLFHAQYGEVGYIDGVMSVYRRHPGGLWSDSYNNLDKILRKWGIQWLGLHVETLKMFEKNPKYEELIKGTIITMMNRLVVIDRRYHENMLEQALTTYPIAGVIYIKDLLKEAKTLHKHSQEQSKIIEHYVNRANKIESEKNLLERKKLIRLESSIKKHLRRK